MVDESERIWFNIDDIRKTLSDHCQRITRIEQDKATKDKQKNWHLAIILGAVAISEFLVFIYSFIK